MGLTGWDCVQLLLVAYIAALFCGQLLYARMRGVHSAHADAPTATSKRDPLRSAA